MFSDHLHSARLRAAVARLFREAHFSARVENPEIGPDDAVTIKVARVSSLPPCGAGHKERQCNALTQINACSHSW